MLWKQEKPPNQTPHCLLWKKEKPPNQTPHWKSALNKQSLLWVLEVYSCARQICVFEMVPFNSIFKVVDYMSPCPKVNWPLMLHMYFVKHKLKNKQMKSEFTKILLLSETHRRPIRDLLETDMPDREFTKILLLSEIYPETYQRHIGDLWETHWRPTCLIGDRSENLQRPWHASLETDMPDRRPQHASSETDMLDRRPIRDLNMLHWRRTCLIGDLLKTSTCFIGDWHAGSETH